MVPEKVGCETVPVAVPDTEIDVAVVERLVDALVGRSNDDATSLAPVPVKVGCVTDLTVVATVVADPFVGSVPASQANVRFSFVESYVADHAGSEPTAVILLTDVVFIVTAVPVHEP